MTRKLILIDFDTFVADIESLFISAVRATLRAPKGGSSCSSSTTNGGDGDTAKAPPRALEKSFLESLLCRSWGSHSSIEGGQNYLKLVLEEEQQQQQAAKGDVDNALSDVCELLRARIFETAEIVHTAFERNAILIKPRLNSVSVIAHAMDKLADLVDDYRVVFVTSDLQTYKQVMHGWCESLRAARKGPAAMSQPLESPQLNLVSKLISFTGNNLVEWEGQDLDELKTDLLASIFTNYADHESKGFDDRNLKNFDSVVVCSLSSHLFDAIQSVFHDSLTPENFVKIEQITTPKAFAEKFEDELLLGPSAMPTWPSKVSSRMDLTSKIIERQLWGYVKPLRLPIFKGKIVKGFRRGGVDLGCPTMNLNTTFSFDADIDMAPNEKIERSNLSEDAESRTQEVESSSVVETSASPLYAARYSILGSQSQATPSTSALAASNTAVTSADGIGFPFPGTYMGWCRLMLNNPEEKSRVKFEPRSGAWPCVMSVGFSPYYANAVGTLEVHVLTALDPAANYRGENLIVEVVGALRPESDFESLDALIGAIQMDCEVSLEVMPSSSIINMSDESVSSSSSEDVVSGISTTVTPGSQGVLLGPSTTLTDEQAVTRSLSVS